MPAEFGFILGSTNSIMEQKFVAASLVNLSRKIPGVKYIYGSESGKKIINTLVGAGVGTGAMTFTEAAQYALGTSEYLGKSFHLKFLCHLVKILINLS